MQFLDAIGLAYFWNKIKNWANSRFFSKKGGEISPESGLQYIINGEQLDVSISGSENETIHIFNVDEDGMEAISIKKSGGTATQVLMADGSVRTLNTSNGIAGLDANGNVPLANLGNLDTTVAEVVTALPTSNIKRHIYLVKDSDTTNNKYAEYIYTGDISAAYDSTKWEKLGDFRADVDLKDYSKKSETISGTTWDYRGSSLVLAVSVADGNTTSNFMPTASSSKDGAMSRTDKAKLDGIAPNANNYSLPLAANGTRGGIKLGFAAYSTNYPVQVNNEEKAFVYIPLATQSSSGLIYFSDQKKLDGIATGATADSAITTEEIDALFA